jgi:hypothetical protein
MKSYPVLVKRPDPATGELIEQTVPADHFKAKLPRLPKLDETRIELVQRGTDIGPTGRSVIYMIGHREEEIAFWEAHANCLTREERSKLARGQATAVQRPLEPAWCKGQRVDVANNVEAEVLEVEENLQGHRTTFRVVDFRPLLPKRVVGGGIRPQVDEFGYPKELTDDEKERARVDGAYTRSAELAVPGVDDELDDKLHQRLNAEASMKTAMQGSHGRVRASKLDLERRLADARAKHRRSTERYLERQIKSLDGKEEKKGDERMAA